MFLILFLLGLSQHRLQGMTNTDQPQSQFERFAKLTDKRNQDALYLAISQNNTEIVKILLNQKKSETEFIFSNKELLLKDSLFSYSQNIKLDLLVAITERLGPVDFSK